LGEDSLAHHLLLVIPLQPDPLRVLLVVLLLGQRSRRDKGRSLDIISLGGHGNVNLVGDGFEPVAPQLLLNSMGQKGVACLVSDVDDSLFGVGRSLHASDFGKVDDLVDEDAGLGGQFIQPQDVDLVDDEDNGLVVEQGLDRVEELALSLDGVSTLLGNVHEVEDSGSQVGEGGDRLHFDRGELLQRSICAVHI
jgi:hypothetical protein